MPEGSRLSRTPFAIACLLAALAVAGCFGGPDEADPAPDARPAPARISSIKPLADTVQLAPPSKETEKAQLRTPPGES